jgi:hypothetical protein
MLIGLNPEFYERLKAEPESARGLMECTVQILVHHYGAKFTSELVLDAVHAAKRQAEATGVRPDIRRSIKLRNHYFHSLGLPRLFAHA